MSSKQTFKMENAAPKVHYVTKHRRFFFFFFFYLKLLSSLSSLILSGVSTVIRSHDLPFKSCQVNCFLYGPFLEKKEITYFDRCMKKGTYSRTSVARTPLGPCKSVRAMNSSSQRRLIIAPGREANIAYSGKSIDLLHNNCMLSVLHSTYNFMIK